MPLKWSTMTDPAPRNDPVSFPAPTEGILVALFIGLEMAEAFCARGLEVTVVEQAPAIMPTVDVELGRLLGEELRRHGVKLVNEVTVKAIHHDAGGLTVAGEPDFAATADPALTHAARCQQ
jgi:NADPH-dependent 2,4-dienoyl-CoA reductase/sulfur reductase-like enzyme